MNTPTTLKNANVIIRDGYGMRDVVSQKIDHAVLNQVKHTFSYDITGLELCYLISGRDIVHLLVEARGHSHNGQMKGSDGYNLIPYPLIKAVGAEIYTLEGRPLGPMIYNPQGIFDFIAGVKLAHISQLSEKCGLVYFQALNLCYSKSK